MDDEGLLAASRTRRWSESLALCALGWLTFRLLDRAGHHSLALDPWSFTTTLMIAVRYGLWPALACAGAWSALETFERAGAAAALIGPTVVSIALAVIVGRRTDANRRRLARLGGELDQARAGVERVQRSAHVLKLSHERLCERLATRDDSLRASLRGTLAAMAQQRTWPALGQSLLELLAAHARVHTASLYALGPQKRFLAELPVAVLGLPPAGAAKHPLVLRALQRRKPIALAELADLSDAEPVLAALPLSTSCGQLLGVLAIHHLPFIAFEPAQLQEIQWIVEHVADAIADRLAGRPLGLDEAPQPSAAIASPAPGAGRAIEPASPREERQAREVEAGPPGRWHGLGGRSDSVPPLRAAAPQIGRALARGRAGGAGQLGGARRWGDVS